MKTINQIKKEIYNLAKKQNQIALKKLLEYENNITDYALEINIYFYKDENKVYTYNKDLKPYFLNDIGCRLPFSIYNISEVTNIEFDINVSYKYKINIQTT